MARPSRNDIRDRAAAFVHEWRGDTYERGEAQSFWTEFLLIFGVQRRRVNAAFERHARRQSTGGRGYIDLLWPGMLLAEHKSAGEDLDVAMDQALDYIDGLSDSELPDLVVVSDFARMSVLRLDDTDREAVTFQLDELPRHIDLFVGLAGYRTRQFDSEDAVNVEAAELLGKVYDEIEATGYGGHELRVFIVRVLFLLFGDDTGLWPKNQFADLVRNRTADDGSDLGMWIGRLFHELDKPESRRTTALDEDLAEFPYVNGGLFEEALVPPDTTRSMRDRLLEACRFDWSQISPAIFGSMFQSVMDREERREIGAHYTSEQNILKLIGPLFLDELEADLEACGNSRQKLRSFHDRLGTLTFFDPACGCGNFLVIAYRELRRLEREALLRLHPGNVQMTTLLEDLRKVDLGQFYGIEVEEFPARIAETAMYLVDHLENEALGAAFGVNLVDLPLQATAAVHVTNALAVDWNDVLPAERCSYLLGNPPFVGKKRRNEAQQHDMSVVFGNRRGSGNLDYVAAWFKKAVEYADGTECRTAFVATSSITQGEQVPILWPMVYDAKFDIDFAHRTFNWQSESRGRAHVHVVIVGFSQVGSPRARRLFDYADMNGPPLVTSARSINPYLVDGPRVVVERRRAPLRDVPPVRFGSMPNDDGNLLLDSDEALELRTADPLAAKYLRPMLSSRQLLHDEERFCLWLEDAPPGDIRRSPELTRRVAAVRQFRADSGRAATQRLAATPALFGEIRQPSERFLCIPRHASENRPLIPMAFYDPTYIASDSTATIEGASLAHFGVLQSSYFAAWVRAVGGRIRNDLRFSNEVVYNTFPFPALSERHERSLTEAAESVLDARARVASASLADMYDPLQMPAPLVRAHRDLDRAMTLAFGKRAVPQTDGDRLAILFPEYERLARPPQLPGVGSN